MRHAPIALALTLLAGPVAAQAARTPPPAAQAAPPAAPAPAPAAAPAAPEAQRTTATFGDWTLRCLRPEHGPAVCEVGQTLFDKAQPVAQTAFGRTSRAEPLRLTVAVPVNVSLAAPVRMMEGDTATLDLSWRRCLPTACVADAPVAEEALRRIRARTENSRLVFQDGAGREAVLPFSPRGLQQALEALAKEDQR